MNKYDKYIIASLEEDLLCGDVTTDAIFTEQKSVARVMCKEEGIIAGIQVFNRSFELIDKTIEINWHVADGQKVEVGMHLATIVGSIKSILKAERVALNYLQRMSGVASLTALYVAQAKATHAKIYDTRKTTPNMRIFEKEAVKIGGGENHRFSLSDQAMIKDNHIVGAGSIKYAVELVKAKSEVLIEVECETIEQVKECLDTNQVDIIMLDNMDNDAMTKCVDLIDGQAIVEASGNMTLDRVKGVAATGVDRISVGALTHSYTGLDISLKM